jgi:hypothetical protein
VTVLVEPIDNVGATFVWLKVLLARANKIFNETGLLFSLLDLNSSGFAQRLLFLMMFNKIFSDFLFLVRDAGGMSEYCITPLLSRQRYTSALELLLIPIKTRKSKGATPAFVE